MHLPNFKNAGPSPLFNLITERQWEDAASRVKYFPNEAKTVTKLCSNANGNSNMKNKVLPIHHACTLNPSLEVMEALLTTYPKAAQKKDSLFKRLPIHVACLHGASSAIIRELLVVYKEGAKTTLMDGQIALHYAVGSGASKDVVLELLKAYPEGARCEDHNGWLPIHIACLQNASLDVIKVLLEAYPESVLMKTKKGNTPVQCANVMKNVGSSNRSDIVSMLRKTERLQARNRSKIFARSQSVSQFDTHSLDHSNIPLIPMRRRCNTT